MNGPFAVNVVAVAISSALAPAGLPAQETVQYAISPGSQYTFKPSPFIGIPGGQPSEFQLDFGVSGFFTVEYDNPADTARILSADIALFGNEAIQNNPPNGFTPVTAARVASYLEERLFAEFQVAGEFVEYAAQQPTGLRLRDFLNGVLTLTGGFDHTPVDGTAMLFNVSASVVPEPASLILVLVAAIYLTVGGGRTTRLRR
jgi:hypothetical protein